jgi:hypothetical protein
MPEAQETAGQPSIRKIADWNHPDAKPRRPIAGNELHDKLLADWASSLHELYIRIGDAFQTPCYWAGPELEPYFPLPPPTI